MLSSGLAGLGDDSGLRLHSAAGRDPAELAPLTHRFNLHIAKAVPVAASSSAVVSARPAGPGMRPRSLTALRIQDSSEGELGDSSFRGASSCVEATAGDSEDRRVRLRYQRELETEAQVIILKTVSSAYGPERLRLLLIGTGFYAGQCRNTG